MENDEFKWEVSICELEQGGCVLFKITRRMPALSVAETKFFKSKEDAKKQFRDWLQ